MNSEPQSGFQLKSRQPVVILGRWAVLFHALFCAGVVTAQEPVEFARDVAPIFEKHCLSCHNPGINKGEISIATADDLRANEFLSLDDPDSSYLLELITPDPAGRATMPKDGAPLSQAQIGVIRDWIAQGGGWPETIVIREPSQADESWWSLQPLKITSAEGNSIDEFIRRKLDAVGLDINPPADRRVLIRRAYYDLLGLPPSPEEVSAFINDPAPNAYAQLVDRLLASPHYGEQWGRHWLDVVRFGESNGYERNVIINSLWPFRDYVIRSFNEDKPLDRFIREHIAGDVIGRDQPEVAVGSAFLVAGPYDDVGNQDPVQAAQIRANTIDEMIRATSEAFLGLTTGCARCHDHKFDPITQDDYYGLYATFAGVHHGDVTLASQDAIERNEQQRAPLEERKAAIEQKLKLLRETVLNRALERLDYYRSLWTRPSVDRTGTEDTFPDVTARFVRLTCDAQDQNPSSRSGFRIDEFEVWSSGEPSVNVALASRGAQAFGRGRKVEDFPEAYGARLAIDGQFGEQFISTGDFLTIELAEPTSVSRVFFSSGRFAEKPEQGKYTFVSEYKIEVSLDGEKWEEVAHGRDRSPRGLDREDKSLLNHRLIELEITDPERQQRNAYSRDLAEVQRQIAELPVLPKVWIGRREEKDAQGPFHVFIGGSPQRLGAQVQPASLAVFDRLIGSLSEPDGESKLPRFKIKSDVPEAERRLALANWMVDPRHPLTARVLVNRVWQYHFGTGIVDTPSDFGYMGGRPTHPELLDFLAQQLIDGAWQLKSLHRRIMLSKTYQQSSQYREDAAGVDSDGRLLWRFPPRRLSAEEVRDTLLRVSGALIENRPYGPDDAGLVPNGGPGFRLYHFMQDNVCTYVPLDKHGPETYRRSVYHQNARAAVVDLLTDFDQPDCAFSIPKRAVTTTPLQALTMLNHSFTMDMARALAERVVSEVGDDTDQQISRLYQLCFARAPASKEKTSCRDIVAEHGLPALCRVLLNTSELIYIL